MITDPKKTVFLIDGSSFLYRAYYGMRPLHTSTGEAVQAVYSFCRMIKKLIKDVNPHYLVIAWDSKGKTSRHELYEEYKANRQAAPSDLFLQKDRVVEFANLIGLKQIFVPGVEADDIMFSVAQDWKKRGDTAVFITSDKDMAQSIDDTIFLFDPVKNEHINVSTFEEKRGFSVKKFPFYIALVGDPSDNIPGVRGIGKK